MNNIWKYTKWSQKSIQLNIFNLFSHQLHLFQSSHTKRSLNKYLHPTLFKPCNYKEHTVDSTSNPTNSTIKAAKVNKHNGNYTTCGQMLKSQNTVIFAPFFYLKVSPQSIVDCNCTGTWCIVAILSILPIFAIFAHYWLVAINVYCWYMGHNVGILRSLETALATCFL